MSKENAKKNRERQSKYRAKLRQILLAMFGGKCALCPQDDPDKLEFDHIKGRDYNPNELSSTARIARYIREAKAGEGRLLCADCNLAERKRNDNGAFVRTEDTILKTEDYIH